MYILWIVMFLGFINTKLAKIINQQKLATSYYPLATLIPLLFCQPLPLFGVNCTLAHFLENKRNSNPHTLCKVGQIQLQLIKTFCFIYLLLQIKPVIIKTFNFKFENVSFTELPANINDKPQKMCFFNFLSLLFFYSIQRAYGTLTQNLVKFCTQVLN